MDNIIPFTGETTVDEDPTVVLEKAKSWGMTGVVILGYSDEETFISGGSISDVERINYLLDIAKASNMKIVLDKIDE